MKKLTLTDLLVIRSDAAKKYAEIPAESKFEGMDSPLTESDRMVIAYFDACTMILNSKGLLKELPELILEVEDSDPIDRIG